MPLSSISIESHIATTHQYVDNLRRQVNQMRPEKAPASGHIAIELQSSPKSNYGTSFPLLAIDTPPQSPVEHISFVESPSPNKLTMKETVKQRFNDLRRHVKQMRSEQVPESKHTESSHRLTMKATVRQYLHNLRRHVKQQRSEQVPESGNTIEPQPTSSKSGCQLKQVPTLFPLVVQCPEKVPESGHISFVEPSCSKSNPEQDRHISFVEPQSRPINSTCGLKRVPTPYPLPAIDTPQSPVEYISLAELPHPGKHSGLKRVPTPFPLRTIDTPPQSPKYNDKRAAAISFAELPHPNKSTCELKRVPTPFPRPGIDTPPQTLKSTDECTLGPLRCGLKQVPSTLCPLPPAIDTTPQSPVEDNNKLTMDSRRCAWYGPPDFFPNARRHQGPFPAEPRYIRPMDLLRDGRSVVGVG